MKSRTWTLFISMALAVAFLFILVPATYAQGSGNSNGNPAGPGWGGEAPSLVQVAANVLGMDQAELVAELQTGLTISQVAADEEKVQEIIDDFVASRADRFTELVSDGHLTQDEADARFQELIEDVTQQVSEPLPLDGNGAGDGDCQQDGSGQSQSGRGGQGKGRL